MNRCISRKDYLKKGNSDVAYSLYVQDNIRKDDYARLNTGEIVKAIEIWENELNKKAMYYDNVYGDWFDAIAVENFSENIIDLIEVGDFVNRERILDITGDYIHTNETDHNRFYLEKHIKTILTKEQYQANCYTVERKEDERI